MFAYCGNNPTSRCDNCGESWQELWETFRESLTAALNEGKELFAIGFAATQADSPLPGVGDAVGLSIIAGAFLACAAIATTTTFDSVQIPKRQKPYQYWAAYRIKNEVVIGEGLTLVEASFRVSLGFDVMCANHDAALWILVLNGYINAVGPEIHGEEGYYYHYHPNRNSHTHIWFN